MTPVAQIFFAEALKQHRRLSGSRLVIFSMLLWPLLELAATFYTIRPVTTAAAAQRWAAVGDPRTLFAFLVTGALAFTFFFAQVQSAWHFSFERQTGTIEVLLLSPVNRLALIVANGAGALVQNTWIFTCFAVVALGVADAVHLASAGMMTVAFLALLVPAVAWGAFLNSFMLFSRDSAFLFTIFGDPMAFAAGARIPLFALPTWLGVIASFLPLTVSLNVVRGALLDGRDLIYLAPDLGKLAAMTVLLVCLAAVILRLGERRAQRTGQMRLF